MKPVKNFMDCWDYSTEELLALADLIRRLKKDAYEGTVPKLLKGQSLAMIFNGNSTRTRVSFEVAAQQLENQQLANAIENSDDPDMLESVARDKGYVKSGETLYIDVAN